MLGLFVPLLTAGLSKLNPVILMAILFLLSCMCPGNRELENESGVVPKLQKPEVGSNVNAGSSSMEDLHNGVSAEDDPTEQKSQAVELEVVIEEMPKWTFLRVFFCFFAPFWFLFSSRAGKQRLRNIKSHRRRS